MSWISDAAAAAWDSAQAVLTNKVSNALNLPNTSTPAAAPVPPSTTSPMVVSAPSAEQVATPKQSVWPWIIGGGVGLLVLVLLLRRR